MLSGTINTIFVSFHDTNKTSIFLALLLFVESEMLTLQIFAFEKIINSFEVSGSSCKIRVF